MSKLYSQSVAHLNTKFIDKCPSDWSQANVISLVTMDGIYILKPQPENPRGPFIIELIRNPREKFKHSLGRNINNFDEINKWKLDFKQQLEIYIDQSLLTNLTSRSLEMYPRRFRCTKWSPLLDVYPKQCFLAVTTIDYQLLIYANSQDNWIVHTDLTKIYDQVWSRMQEEQQNNKVNIDQFEELRQVLHEVSFSSLCWKRIKASNEVGYNTYLLSATLTGDIVLWKVLFQSLTTSLGITKIFRTNLARITAMSFYESFLIVTTQDGRLTLFDLTNCFDDESATIDDTTISNQQQVQMSTIDEWAELWHSDGIEISDFCIQKISETSFRIIISKSTHICWSIVEYSRDLETGSNTIFLKDTYASIDGCDPDVTMHQMPPISLKSSTGEKVIFAALDGSIFELKFIPSRPDLGPECTAIRFDRLDLTRTVPGGLCASPNGHLIVLVSTISMLYEPQKIFAPTKVILFPWVGNSEFLMECLNNLLSEDWLRDKNITSPMDVCDMIDYLRSIYPLLTHEHYQEIYMLLKNESSKLMCPKNLQQFTKLKIVNILLEKILSQNNSKMIEAKDMIELDSLYRAIQIYNHRLLLEAACHTEDSIIIDEGINCSRQLKSLDNMRKWLRKYNEDLLKEFSQLSLLDDKQPETETCMICNEVIPFENERNGHCVNGHLFDRCAHSLVIIDLITTQYLKCDDCNRFYIVPPIWSNRTGWLCCFCQ